MIFANMSRISKPKAWQRQFLSVLLTTVFAMRGRLTFTNLARFSSLHEQTFRRQFAKFFDWIEFNLAVLALAPVAKPDRFIAAIDCTFVGKSGKKTWGLDRFWSSTLGKARRGLEVSVLALIETGSGRSWSVDATQTPPDLASGKEASDQEDGYTRVDFYLEQLADCLSRCSSRCSKRLASKRLAGVQHIVADGFYAKTKVFNFLASRGKYLITRLRSDANLRYFYTGPRKKGPGAPKLYDGKVLWDDLSRFDYIGTLSDKEHIALYTKLLNSPYFKRDFRIVVMLNTKTSAYVVLASTDAGQSAREVVRFYRLRFQIELIFRDAKQFAGLTHCQARSQEKLDFHFNMSLAAVNVARLELLLYEALRAGRIPQQLCPKGLQRSPGAIAFIETWPSGPV